MFRPLGINSKLDYEWLLNAYRRGSAARGDERGWGIRSRSGL